MKDLPRGSVPHTLFRFSEILPLLGNPLSSPEKSFSRAVEIPGWGRWSSALCANLLKASGSNPSKAHLHKSAKAGSSPEGER